MNTSIIINELRFKAIRSSGAGGQHVNKVSSKIELSFNIVTSLGLTDNEKLLLGQKLSSRLTKEGVLILQCGDSRSQHRNKELVIKRFVEIVKANLQVPKKRKATKPSRSAIKKRLNNKQKQSEKKINRKKPLL
ncbi:alternative ribosome rescue aminoacyl-tRNA hydrolase ArfB [Aquimarina sp. AU474]|uniref:alternative ribosome rescue aminoacyl-tRNA hydrolase ArfB n=1 Tax=Aquimarina sp. AU474 TaxID=2108529 RepID=UPI000D69060C|nr:alternative ribosome rescue aminoacyl-tRNA hydrolase ArfB [Aquimarina sp. AU474]